MATKIMEVKGKPVTVVSFITMRKNAEILCDMAGLKRYTPAYRKKKIEYLLYFRKIKRNPRKFDYEYGRMRDELLGFK